MTILKGINNKNAGLTFYEAAGFSKDIFREMLIKMKAGNIAGLLLSLPFLYRFPAW
jgi:hypothetical protein